MEPAIVNSFLYIITLYIYIYIRRKIDVGFVILTLYAITAVLCVLYLKDHQNEWDLNYWSFIYLYVIVMLAVRPFLMDTSSFINKIKIRNINFLNNFIYIYCFCALIDIYYGSSLAIENVNSGEWATLRMDMYAGEIKLYNNQIERFAKIFVSYLKPLAIIILFVSLIYKNINKKWLFFLTLSIVFTTFLVAINTASRGLIVSLIFSFLCAFIWFKNKLNSKIKRTIYFIGSSFLVLFLIYSIAVTNSRFGDGDQSSSLLFYFGHSMLVFNYGLTDTIEAFGNGSYFFDWLIKFLGYTPIDISDLGTHFGTSFFTFVGAWYIDFGPNGTFIIALLIPMYFVRILKKQVIGIPELFLCFVYLNYLFMGVFVIGRNNSIAWISTIIIYLLLKIKRV
ncbi:O-antigen polymerase [Polaribacter sp. SA4-12]|uniref:O-antigen polymerase n=1 Tax=Polaribacter sp. SA4-12 TaxID=1312072 RepID=UPI000B3BE13F|nr:O-antigen polymerase [Polaribacter sp. SA4-12]ARV15112.1 hypothetical protein BTO07_08085 [Polaribacter sp. SA4-12]